MLVFNSRGGSWIAKLTGFISSTSFFFTICGWVETENQARKVIGTLLLSTIGVACFGFYQAIIGDYGTFYFQLYPHATETMASWNGRITSLLNYCNTLAGYLNLVLPISLALIVVPLSRTLRLLAVICFLSGTVALLLAQSRGGFASLLAILLLGVFYLPNKVGTKKWSLRIVLLSSGAILALVFAYLRAAWAPEDDWGRVLLFGAAWKMFVSAPLFGVGYGNFRELYNIPGIDPNTFDVHNLYLEFLAETGILGLFAFLSVMVRVIRSSSKGLKVAQRDLTFVLNFSALAALVGVLTHGFVDFLFIGSAPFAALFWLILALWATKGKWQGDRPIGCESREFARGRP
jgi:putative inorganic carbon (HCO3(-)) transporter